MSLTTGTGPFGHQPWGSRTPAGKGPLLEPSPRRIRGIVGDQVIVDCRVPMLLFEHGELPRYYFPRESVRTDLLTPNGRTETAEGKGTARYADRPRRPGGRERGVDLRIRWRPGAGPAAVCRLLLAEHGPLARGGYGGAGTRPRPVPSRRRRAEFASGAGQRRRRGPRRERAHGRDLRDVAPAALVLPARGCPGCARAVRPAHDLRVQGHASYWSVRVGDGSRANLAWTYEQPRRDAEPVRDMVCFFNEQVDLELDGEVGERPVSPWSEPDWWRGRWPSRTGSERRSGIGSDVDLRGSRRRCLVGGCGRAGGFGSGSGGGVPPQDGHIWWAHQSQSLLGLGRQSPVRAARSMARQSASTLRSVASRSASSGS